MNAQELIQHLNRVFGMEKAWPKTYEVDPATYGECCQTIFSHETTEAVWETPLHTQGLVITVGPNKGLMFKGVELILQRR